MADTPKVPIDLSHPDIKAISNRDTIYYAWEFSIPQDGTGPHVAISGLTRANSIKLYISMFLFSHPHVVPDWAKGFKAFPNIFAAIEYANQRKEQLYAENPNRVGAEQVYPDVPNRILEATKPE